MVEALNLALDEAMAADEDVMVMGQDVGINGGVFRVTRGLFERYGRDRVMDTPLAECGIIVTRESIRLWCHKFGTIYSRSMWTLSYTYNYVYQ